MSSKFKRYVHLTLFVFCLLILPNTLFALDETITVYNGDRIEGGYGHINGEEVRVYSTTYHTSGGTAYCLNPGKPFPNEDKNQSQTYHLKDVYDLSSCKKSNDNIYCGFAYVIQAAEYRFGGDYVTVDTGLRLFAAYNGFNPSDEDYWSDADGKKYDRAFIYKTTANLIKDGQYKDGAWLKEGVLYGDTPGIAQGMDLFAETTSPWGADLWYPASELLDVKSVTDGKSYLEKGKNGVKPIPKNAGPFTITVQTTFNEHTKEKTVSVDNGAIIQSESWGNCPENNKVLCLTLTVDTSQVTSDEFNILVDYVQTGDLSGSMGYYEPDAGTGFQNMIIYEPSHDPVRFEIPIKLKTDTCRVETNPETNEMICYDINGKPDCQSYLETCEAGICQPPTYSPIVDDYICYDAYGNMDCDSYYETCETDLCEEPYTSITYDLPSECEEGGHTNEINDPEVCTLLHTNKTVEENYSTSYGNAYCKILCRETLKFSFMSKEEAQAGRYFQHNVEAKYSQISNLSTVIMSTRQCANEIDYDEWKGDYNETNAAVLSSWNALKFWETLYNHIGEYHEEKYYQSCKHSTGCCDRSCTETDSEGNDYNVCCDDGCSIGDCGQDYYVWYWGYMGSGPFPYNISDEYGGTSRDEATHTSGSATCNANCCSGTCQVTIKPPTDAEIRSNYRAALGAYKSNLSRRDQLLYQLQDCNYVTDVKVDGTYYKPDGGYYTVSQEGNYHTNAALKTYQQVKKYEPGNIVDVDYEENYTYNEGFNISRPLDRDVTELQLIERNYNNDEDWHSYCGSECTKDLSTLSKNFSTERLTYFDCSGSEEGAQCTRQEVTVPISKVANIILERETAHYQGTDFYTQVFTGDISTSGGSLGYWIPMEPHPWPVGIKRITGDYEMEITLEKLGDPKRVVKIEDQDLMCSYHVTNDLTIYDCDDGYHVCYPCDPDDEYCYQDPTPGEESRPDYDLGVYFRSIDLEDIFPNSQFSPKDGVNTPVTRRIGQNWASQGNIIKEIQDLGDKIWTNTPQYSIVLSPSTIKKIKSYNKQRHDYLDYSISCDANLRCTSDFLNSSLKTILEDKYYDLYKKDTTISNDRLYYYKGQ